MKYCAHCGEVRPAADIVPPCPQCGERRTTSAPPSREPCAYCGDRPTWAVLWHSNGEEYTVYLCASCDAREARSMQEDD